MNNKLEDLLKRVLADEGDIDWSNPTTCKILTTLKSEKSSEIVSGRDIGLIDCDSEYFLFCYNAKNIKTSLDDLNKSFDSILKKNNEIAKDIVTKKKVTIVAIIPDIESRIRIETSKTLEKFNETLKTQEKVKFKLIPIVWHKKTSKSSEIANFSRYSVIEEPELINSLNHETEPDNKTNNKTGYAATVYLVDLIKLYNEVGDSLFDDNVRYGIKETLQVNASIKQTLENRGEDFWFLNNGITILVKSSSFELKYTNRVIFEKDTFSVINGAQTLTVSASYYYEIKEKHKNSKDNDEKEKYMKIINSINKARVLLRIIRVDANSKDGKAISVALNRQKPIKSEDIAYSLDYVEQLNEFANKATDYKKFDIIKRGENCLNGSLDLFELSKIRLACMGRPSEARNKAASTTLRVSLQNNKDLVFSNKDIFPEIQDEGDFLKYYNAVRFVHDFFEEYEKNMNEVIKDSSLEDENTLTKRTAFIRNGRWYMISHIVTELNKSKEDYSNFNYKICDFSVKSAMKKYFDEAVKYIENISTTTFKSDSWYSKEYKRNMKSVVDEIEASFNSEDNQKDE